MGTVATLNGTMPMSNGAAPMVNGTAPMPNATMSTLSLKLGAHNTAWWQSHPGENCWVGQGADGAIYCDSGDCSSGVEGTHSDGFKTWSEFRCRQITEAHGGNCYVMDRQGNCWVRWNCWPQTGQCAHQWDKTTYTRR